MEFCLNIFISSILVICIEFALQSAYGLAMVLFDTQSFQICPKVLALTKRSCFHLEKLVNL